MSLHRTMPTDSQIRNLECANTGYDDIRTAMGARRVRLTQLIEQYRGKIDIKNAKKIIADHYDVYLEKVNSGSRTVEGHYELDAMEYWPARLPYTPHGAVDGKVDQIQVRPLLIHGLADTNVHLQNSVNLVEAMMAIDKPFDFLPLPNSDHHYGGDGLVGVLSESAKYFVEHLGNR